MRIGRLVLIMIVIVATSISIWIQGVRMRRRVKRTLGKDVKSEAELTSLNLWMKVKDAEEHSKGRD